MLAELIWLADTKGVLVHSLLDELAAITKRYGPGATALEVAIWRRLYQERWRKEQKRAAMERAQAERLRHRKGR